MRARAPDGRAAGRGGAGVGSGGLCAGSGGDRGVITDRRAPGRRRRANELTLGLALAVLVILIGLSDMPPGRGLDPLDDLPDPTPTLSVTP